MTYNFKCEYSKVKDNQFCSDCGDKLERIIKWDGPTGGRKK